ncbi:MAG: hypothetical protein JNL70_15490 [Saprospiraceae bacterium]|nr:hypothetical protein [Saprospiraceae bacterium]
MAKKKSQKQKKYADYETVAKISFGEMDYEISDLTFAYTFTQEPIFKMGVTVKVPDDVYEEAIRMEIPLSEALPVLSHKHPAMAEYVEKTIEGFDDPHFKEELAIEALKEEGFDIEHFARCVLNGLEVEMFWDPDLPPPTPQIKNVQLGALDYKIPNIDISYGDDEAAPVFTFHATVELPKHVIDKTIIVNMPLHKVLEEVQKYNAPMVDYVEQTLADHAHEPDPEVVAIQSLAAEGFDLRQFLKYALNDFEFQIKKND